MPDDASPPRPPLALIGAGALGSALARACARAGYRVEAVFSRTAASAEALAEAVGAPTHGTDLHALPATVRAVVCCVPDDAIRHVADALSRVDHPWSETLAVHTSGARTTAELAPLAALGALPLSFHPVQSFPPGSSPDRFAGICVTLEGPEAARAHGRRLAEALGARPVALERAAKTRVHLAAAVASNFFVALQAMAGEILTDAGLTRPEAAALVRPLVEGTWQNLQERLPEEALTGPIARGDRATVADHLDALRLHLPHLVPVYTGLAVETVRVAVRGGTLSPDEARPLLDLLQATLDG